MHRHRAAACPFFASIAALCLLLVACGRPLATVTPTPATLPTVSSAAAIAVPASVSLSSPGQPAATAAAPVAPTTAPSPTVAASATPRVAMAISPGAARFAIDPQRSLATYRVGEKFLGEEISVRVATVSGVGGNLYVDRQRSSASSASVITVDIRDMTSDLTGHDRVRNEFMQTRYYPNITFTPQRISGLPDLPLAENTPISFQLSGEMTVRTISRPVTFEATGTLNGATFTGSAQAKIQITDFGFTLPTMPTLELDNNVYLEITIVAVQAP